MTRSRGIPILLGALLVLLLWVFRGDLAGPAAPYRPPEAATQNREGTVPAAMPEAAAPGAASAKPETAGEIPGTHASEPGDLCITGIVCRQDGVTPLGGVRIDAQQGDVRRNAQTDASGGFRLTGFEPGDVYVAVKQPPDGAGGRIGRMIAAGSRHVRLILAPRGRLRLDVVDAATGEPVTARLRVIEITERGERTRITATGGLDPDFGDLLLFPGRRFRFKVVAFGYAPSEVLSRDFAMEQPVQTLRVSLRPDPGSIATLVLKLRLGGRAPPRARLTRYRLDGDAPEIETGVHMTPRGQMDMKLIPGSHDFEVQAGGALGGPWAAVRIRVQIEPGQTVEKTLSFPRGGYVEVRSPDGEPPLFLWFFRNDLASRGVGVRVEDEQGVRVRFGPLEAGKWLWARRFSDREDAQEIEVRAGEITILDLPR